MTTSTPVNRLLALREALPLLGGISRQSLDRYAKAGLVKLTRVGGRVLISEDEVRRIVADGAKFDAKK